MRNSLFHAGRALRYRNFRLFFMGQGISLVGTWMTRMATGWLVYRLTGSALLLGIVGFAGQIVPFLLQPLAGAWVERMDRRKLLIRTQAAAAIQSFVLAALTLSHIITIWEIIALSALQGLVNAFDAPGRHSFFIQMIEDRNDLGNAIALNSTMVNGARLLGPALAGVTIGLVGEGGCFLIDGISYIAVVASLLMMKIKPVETAHTADNLFRQVREGWNYVRGFSPLRTILLLFSIVSLMGYPYMVLLPVFAGQVFHGGPYALGWLTAASGLGALISALSLAFRKSVVGLTRTIQMSSATLGVALILFGFSRQFALSLLLMGFAGFGMMQSASASNTVIQTLVPEDKRARVISYYAMAYFGSAPIGSLLAGALAQKIGAAGTIIITGTFCFVGSLWFSLQMPKIGTAMRPIYQEMGLLPKQP
ncbi:MFS transporter [Oryzomonas japonica]|uniref:MFS transporter n=1 Tax=Oryzomonas japonica TaxID=2603858 RepID=A0A7J4ZN96_9BACT|nr:MFS transporter [Oryzomonas japonica]KAB0664221.1 MFS transporter [Oryzomonas japonica]